jgi:hypothetical protein
MKPDFKALGVVLFLMSFPALMALPQSLLVSDVPLVQAPGPDHASGEEPRMPLFGKITAIRADALEISNPNGEAVTVKLTPKTEFRRDRQAARRSDFKVGDVIIVRGEENPDHTWTAQVVGARSAGEGREGRGRGNMQAGALGKDYVAGEVKAIDAPKISVLRTDNVTQSIELNEDSSLRRGRDSITMAEVQVGDHLFARGAMQNDVFVPKFVMVVGPEQWKRMQEMGGMGAGPAGARRSGPQTQKPPEPQR